MQSSARTRQWLTIIVILSGIGVVVAGYGLWQHYAPVGSSFCNISARISCDIVNKSPWSAVYGIPVALIGMIGYVVLGALAVAARRTSVASASRASQLALWLLVLALVGLLVQGSLTYIEFFVIGVVCPVCIASQVLMLGIALCAIGAYTQGVWNHGDVEPPQSSSS